MQNLEIIKTGAKKNFDNAICLMSIIPFLAFIYVLVGKIASFSILAGEIGYILLLVLFLILLGIFSGKKIIWLLMNKIFDFNHKIIEAEKKLLEQTRLNTISQTVLSLSHEINNPLLVMQGNLAILEEDIASNNVPDSIQNRFKELKTHCERIVEVTDKMSRLTKPAFMRVYGNTNMVDLENSR